MNVKLIQNCSQSSILIAEPLRFSQSLRTLRLHRWETSTALLQRGYLPSALTSAQSRRFAFKCPFSALQGVLEHEAEQPQVSDVPQSKQDPESKQESVSAVQVPLEAAIPMEQLFSAPAAQYLLPILGEAPPGEPPDPKKCSPREYLEFYIFPVVLPGLAALLHETEKEKCFEVRCDSEIQELRQWQKKLREERHIHEVVKKFWAKQEAKVGSKSEELD
nr:IQ domain-containing protein K isoform X8 [Taeniopygia guttata]